MPVNWRFWEWEDEEAARKREADDFWTSGTGVLRDRDANAFAQLGTGVLGALREMTATGMQRKADAESFMSWGGDLLGSRYSDPYASGLGSPGEEEEPSAIDRALRGAQNYEPARSYEDPYASGLGPKRTEQTPLERFGRPLPDVLLGEGTGEKIRQTAQDVLVTPNIEIDERLRVLSRALRAGTATPEEEDEYHRLSAEQAMNIGPLGAVGRGAKVAGGVIRAIGKASDPLPRVDAGFTKSLLAQAAERLRPAEAVGPVSVGKYAEAAEDAARVGYPDEFAPKTRPSGWTPDEVAAGLPEQQRLADDERALADRVRGAVERDDRRETLGLHKPSVFETAQTADELRQMSVDAGPTGSWGQRLLISGERIRPDMDIVVYHGTDRATAEKILRDGWHPEGKPSNIARQRFEAGEYAEFAPGRGLDSGLYVGALPDDVSGYGDTVLAIRVKARDITPSREHSMLSSRDPVPVDPIESLRVNDAVIRSPISPSDIIRVGEPGQYPSGSVSISRGSRPESLWAQAARKLRPDQLGDEAGPFDRYYHGTAAAFDRPDPLKFDQNGLFGPGYYLTSEPKVAGGYGTARQSMNDLTRVIENQQRLLQDPSLSPELRASYQRTLDELLERGAASGPNIRPVDVPRGLRLVDMDSVPKREFNRVVRKLAGELEEADWLDPAAYQSLDTVYRDIKASVPDGIKRANSALAGLGYDGIKYAGGKRTPMLDDAGKPIEHSVAMIFPESLDKVRNALSLTKGGGFVPDLGGAAVGGTAGGLAGDEELSPEERARNVAIGLGGGMVAPRIARMLATKVRIPDDPVFRDAVQRVGGKITPEGVELFLIRAQSPKGELAEALRGGVFYEAAKPGSTSRFLSKFGLSDVGGSEQVSAPTLLKAPLVEHGGVGGSGDDFLDRVYARLNMPGVRDRVDRSMAPIRNMLDWPLRRPSRAESLADVLEGYGGESGVAESIVRDLQPPEWTFAVHENIIANAARKAGYDSIVNVDEFPSWWTVYEKNGRSVQQFTSEDAALREAARVPGRTIEATPIHGEISELMDLREARLPSTTGGFELRPEFPVPPEAQPGMARQGAENALRRMLVDEYGEVPEYFGEKVTRVATQSPGSQFDANDLAGILGTESIQHLEALGADLSARRGPLDAKIVLSRMMADRYSAKTKYVSEYLDKVEAGDEKIGNAFAELLGDEAVPYVQALLGKAVSKPGQLISAGGMADIGGAGLAGAGALEDEEGERNPALMVAGALLSPNARKGLSKAIGRTAAKQVADDVAKGASKGGPTGADFIRSVAQADADRLAEMAAEVGRPGVLEYVKATARTGLIGPATAVANIGHNVMSVLYDVPKDLIRATSRGHPGEFVEELAGAAGDMLRGVSKALDVVLHGQGTPDYPTLAMRETNPIGRMYLQFLGKGMDVFAGAPDALIRPLGEGMGMRRAAAQIATEEGLPAGKRAIRMQQLLDEAEAVKLGNVDLQRGIPGIAEDVSQATRGGAAVSPEVQRVMDEGKRMADRWGLQGGVEFGEFGEWGMRAVNSKGPLGWLMHANEPFFPTMYRGASILGEKVPLLGLAAKQPTRFDKVYDQTAGTLIMLGATAAAAAGLTTGSGPKDKNHRERLEAEGAQWNSTLVAGHYVPNRNFGIWGPVLNAAGEIADAMRYRKDDMDTGELWQDAVRRLGRIAQELPVAGGLGDILLALGGQGTERIAAGYLGRAVPYGATLRTAATAMDPSRREPQTVGERFSQTFPWSRQSTPAAMDVLGRTVPNENVGLAALLPKTRTQQAPNPVLREVDRLKMNFPVVSDSIGDEKLPAADARKYRELAQTLRGNLADALIESKLYRRADDAEKAKLLGSAVRKAQAWAAQTVRPDTERPGGEYLSVARGRPERAISGYMTALEGRAEMDALLEKRFPGLNRNEAKALLEDKALLASYRRTLGQRQGEVAFMRAHGATRFTHAKNRRDNPLYRRQVQQVRKDYPELALYLGNAADVLGDAGLEPEDLGLDLGLGLAV